MSTPTCTVKVRLSPEGAGFREGRHVEVHERVAGYRVVQGWLEILDSTPSLPTAAFTSYAPGAWLRVERVRAPENKSPITGVLEALTVQRQNVRNLLDDPDAQQRHIAVGHVAGLSTAIDLLEAL